MARCLSQTRLRHVTEQIFKYTKVKSSQTRRSFAIHVSGDGWTGALGLGHDIMIGAKTSEVSEEERENSFTEVKNLPGLDKGEVSIKKIEVTSGACGWGHTAIVVSDNYNGVKKSSRLLVCGRPYDFQTLLRLKRLPSFARRRIVANSLNYTDANGNSTKDHNTFMGRLLNAFMTSGQKVQDTSFISATNDEILPSFIHIELPDGEIPAISNGYEGNQGTQNNSLAASAGVTAVISESGKLFTFGLNLRGQCGVGQDRNNHVWEPTAVTGLIPRGESAAYSENACAEQMYAMKTVCLGLQHGMAVDVEGNLFAWGKGERGQLGIESSEFERDILIPNAPIPSPIDDDPEKSNINAEFSAVQVTDFVLQKEGESNRNLTKDEAKVKIISAGLNHSAGVTESNHAWVWGKNVKNVRKSDANGKNILDGLLSEKLAIDSNRPFQIQGLPQNLKIVDLSCGSHHTAILMEDGSVYGTGIATDTVKPIVESVVEMVPPGFIDMPVRQFASHFDRTSVVGRGGKQVLELQLWSTDELRKKAVFEPAWVEELLINDECGEKDKNSIRMIHRGWLQTLVITEP